MKVEPQAPRHTRRDENRPLLAPQTLPPGPSLSSIALPMLLTGSHCRAAGCLELKPNASYFALTQTYLKKMRFNCKGKTNLKSSVTLTEERTGFVHCVSQVSISPSRAQLGNKTSRPHNVLNCCAGNLQHHQTTVLCSSPPFSTQVEGRKTKELVFCYKLITKLRPMEVSGEKRLSFWNSLEKYPKGGLSTQFTKVQTKANRVLTVVPDALSALANITPGASSQAAVAQRDAPATGPCSHSQ